MSFEMLYWEDGHLVKICCSLPPVATLHFPEIPSYVVNTFAYTVWNGNKLQKIFTLAFQPPDVNGVPSGQLSFGGIDPAQTDVKYTPLSKNSTNYMSF